MLFASVDDNVWGYMYRKKLEAQPFLGIRLDLYNRLYQMIQRSLPLSSIGAHLILTFRLSPAALLECHSQIDIENMLRWVAKAPLNLK
jgi:hypothetical protein